MPEKLRPNRATLEQIVGWNLTKYREQENISQAELGRRIGSAGRAWSRQAVHQAEAGKRAFGISDLVAIAIGTGMTIADLLDPGYDVQEVDLGGDQPVRVALLERLQIPGLTREQLTDLKMEGYGLALADVSSDLNRRIQFVADWEAGDIDQGDVADLPWRYEVGNGDGAS
ncbi:helix-turn-helix transcriptional regulator [Kocuria turfanensis]|uniref:HTH cro/C1-type domain-containing protein n=1 Tax=Kocuria turfanensis TaxID=388357 RepID=A0A512IBY6_9MICC|nr:helix-turn-helix transcriptional regulator [Kocuria turfanensis]GEO95209.1 hypothetical protein KTU01_13320 [Kocuria turfanensis]